MHFYRPRRPVKAIMFDVDDTLYDNLLVVKRAQEENPYFLKAYHTSLRQITRQQYPVFSDRLWQQEPDIYHDVTEWRRCAVVATVPSAGLTETEAEKGSQAVMVHFAHWRSQIDIPAETHRTLTVLVSQVPLVAITHDNAQPHLFSVDHYFNFVLCTGLHGCAKPYQDMYQLAAKKRHVALENILYVGDDLSTDVAGSVSCVVCRVAGF